MFFGCQNLVVILLIYYYLAMETKNNYLTPYQIDLGTKIFKYINIYTLDNASIWNKGNEIRFDTPYKVLDKKGNCIGLFMDFNHLGSETMKKIYERIHVLDFEFFMYYFKDRVRIGWRIDSKIGIK